MKAWGNMLCLRCCPLAFDAEAQIYVSKHIALREVRSWQMETSFRGQPRHDSTTITLSLVAVGLGTSLPMRNGMLSCRCYLCWLEEAMQPSTAS